jgi:hypothetical protein
VACLLQHLFCWGRSEFANLFHSMADMLNVFQSLHVAGIINISESANISLWQATLQDVSLFFLDEHPQVRVA